MIHSFTHPYMFFLLIPLALVLLRAWFKPVPALRVPSLRPFRAASGSALKRIPLRKLIPFLLYAVGGVCLITALAGPREGTEEIRRRADGIDIMVALDLSGRPYLVYNLVPPAARIKELDTALFKEFFQAFCVKGGINLHVQLLKGAEVHHVFEAVFKGLGRALAQAVETDPRETGIPSTKGSL